MLLPWRGQVHGGLLACAKDLSPRQMVPWGGIWPLKWKRQDGYGDIYIYIHILLYIYNCISYIFKCDEICMYTCVYLYVCIWDIKIYTYMYLWYVSMYIYIYMYICIYIYIYDIDSSRGKVSRPGPGRHQVVRILNRWYCYSSWVPHQMTRESHHDMRQTTDFFGSYRDDVGQYSWYTPISYVIRFQICIVLLDIIYWFTLVKQEQSMSTLTILIPALKTIPKWIITITQWTGWGENPRRKPWLLGGLEHFLFFHIEEISSSQLTNSYFSEG